MKIVELFDIEKWPSCPTKQALPSIRSEALDVGASVVKQGCGRTMPSSRSLVTYFIHRRIM